MTGGLKCLSCGAVVMRVDQPSWRLWLLAPQLIVASAWHWLWCDAGPTLKRNTERPPAGYTSPQVKK